MLLLLNAATKVVREIHEARLVPGGRVESTAKPRARPSQNKRHRV